jgi:hypothetical protein
MSQKLLFKVGYYSIFFDDSTNNHVVDSGKTINLKWLNKTVINTNRDVKEFKNVEDAKSYAKKKIDKSKKKKAKVLKTIPKSLYLIIMKEESSGKRFVKVGITAKKFISRRFSKEYGYEGYEIDTILRRVESSQSERLEKKIKDELNKKRSINKYRPLLESFSGYSECYNIDNLIEIIEIFDKISLKRIG